MEGRLAGGECRHTSITEFHTIVSSRHQAVAIDVEAKFSNDFNVIFGCDFGRHNVAMSMTA